MRHRVSDKRFNRDANERKALFSGLLRNFMQHGEITTTLAKAKVLKRLADHMIGQAQDNSVPTRRLLHKRFGKRDVVNTIVERVAPAMKDRTSGFVRIVALGNRRGDNTPMARVSLMATMERPGSLQSGKDWTTKKVKKTQPKVEKAVEKKVVKAKAKPVAKPKAKK